MVGSEIPGTLDAISCTGVVGVHVDHDRPVHRLIFPVALKR